jgi:hypothetical protein
MEESKQEEYYQMALKWANNYLATTSTTLDFKCFDGHILHDTHHTINVWIYRLQHAKNREKHAAFIKIKKFKDFITLQEWKPSN